MLYGPKAGGQKEKSVLSVERFSSPGGKTRCTVIIHADSGLTGDGMGWSLIRAPELSDLVKRGVDRCNMTRYIAARIEP